MELDDRASVHAALGDPHRLRMVDALARSDRTFTDLATAAGLPGNATDHHLAVLEAAGLIQRRVSEGDHRRRYITLRRERLDGLGLAAHARPRLVLFVCTANSARSQFAAALWARRTGFGAESAGAAPAATVHPGAIRAAERYGLDLRGAAPRGYADVALAPDLVVSVCDRAFEGGLPFDAPAVHWSVPDPVPAGTPAAFEAAFADVAMRVERLAAAVAA